MDTSVNAANQVVSVGADIAFDADPKFFACLVRFESSSVPTTLPTAYDVYPLDVDLILVCGCVGLGDSLFRTIFRTADDGYPLECLHEAGCNTVKDCVTIEVIPSAPFFFFQAEDGIRDLTVTGVQTCALPI